MRVIHANQCKRAQISSCQVTKLAGHLAFQRVAGGGLSKKHSDLKPVPGVGQSGTRIAPQT